MANEMTENYWSKFASSYDENQQYVVGKEFTDQITTELDSLPELGKVVELGCGTGYFTEAIVRKSKLMIATDLSDNLLDMAKKRLGEYSKVTLQKENCMATSFPAESFDTVFMANLIHVIENPGELLRESHRILRNRGTIIIVTFTSHGMKLWEKIKMGFRFSKVWGKPPKHTHSFSPGKLTSLIEQAGFEIKSSKLIGNRTKALFIIGKKGGTNAKQYNN